jgi:hypothetical protein
MNLGFTELLFLLVFILVIPAGLYLLGFSHGKSATSSKTMEKKLNRSDELK